MRVEKRVRAPLCLLGRISSNGWADEPKIVAHRTSYGDWWHEAEFRTYKAAKAAFDQLAQHKAALSTAEYMKRARGGR